ncbi:fibronectin type III domain-containing protein [Flavobacterium piscinae]|nr:fibronectin type III domain-containing protein [Flavobacterium piscinae]
MIYNYFFKLMQQYSLSRNFSCLFLFLLFGFSISSSAQCDQPSNFRITTRTPDVITIEWDPPANSSNVDGYDYRISNVQQVNQSWPEFTSTPSVTFLDFRKVMFII